MWCPHGGLVVNRIGISYIGIQALVARCQSLVHRLGIDEELEGGTRLAHGRHLVILPRLEVYIAHPSLHLASVWFDGHKTAVHKPHHIAYGVHRTQLLLLHPVIGENLHGMRLVEVILHGVGLVGKAFLQIFIMCSTLGQVFYEVRNLPVLAVLPRWCTAPMIVKALLYDLHLLEHSLLGISLHAAVQRSIDGQSVGIEVQFVVSVIAWHKPLLA